MTIIGKSLACALFLSAIACSSAQHAPAVAPTRVTDARNVEFKESVPPLAGSGLKAAPVAMVQLGDRKVHEFRGRLQKVPLRLSEEVVEVSESQYRVEYTLCELKAGAIHSCESPLRVLFAHPSERVLQVEQLSAKRYEKASLETYQQLIERTLMVSERNLGKLEEKEAVCLIGSQEVQCKKTRYSIMLDGKKAELLLERGAVGNLSGEMRALDGSILYHSELVELSRANPRGQERKAAQRAEVSRQNLSTVTN